VFTFQQGKRSTETFLRYYVVKNNPPKKSGEQSTNTLSPETAARNGGMKSSSGEIDTSHENGQRAQLPVKMKDISLHNIPKEKAVDLNDSEHPLLDDSNT